MRFATALCAALALVGCNKAMEAVDEVGSMNAGEGDRLEANSGGEMSFQGEFAIGGKTWTPNECVKTDYEGMTGMIFMNESAGYALAVWTSGVPEGESNVWVADMNQPPPPDEDFSAGKGRCGKVKTKEGQLLAGATKVSCGEGATGEVRFRNCPDASSGAAAASVTSWPPK